MRTSRLTARVDKNPVDDGFQIYLHSFVLARDRESAIYPASFDSDCTGEGAPTVAGGWMIRLTMRMTRAY